MQYFVCQISRELLLGQMTECETLEEAITLTKEIVQEKGIVLAKDVIDEIESDYSYVDKGFEWSVCIGIISVSS